ncbi:MAG: prolipoprotein diacylglyceryl transferase [Bacteroidales bacterium]|nr:prolipoprotein diacylglyceryl transferase [Bacteroidales bacterium]
MTDLIIHWSADPVIFHIGSFGLRWYSLLFAVGFISAYFILLKMFRREEVDTNYLDKLTIYCFIALLVGLRFGHCIFYEWSYYKDHLLEIVVPFNFETGKFTGYQGLASHGGAIGILLGLWLYCYKTKVNPVWILDRLVIVIPLVGACVRCGNLMNSEIYGSPTSLPWGFVFLRGDKQFCGSFDNYTSFEVHKELPICPSEEWLPCHPTGLYEALSYLIIFAVLLIIYLHKKGKIRPGMSFGIFLIALFGMRFLIEFLKNEQVDFEKGMTLNMGQLLSIPFILAGIVFIVLSVKGKFSGKVFYKTTNAETEKQTSKTNKK